MGDASSSLPPEQPALDPGAGAMPESPMDDMSSSEGELSGKVKEIVDTANEISEKDQDTLLKYARSLKDASENTGAEGEMPGGDMGGEPMPPTQDAGMPMQESVIFTKKQLKHINENFVQMDGELDREKELGHTTKVKDEKNNEVSPFDPPKKNRK